jgi:hypothetical protein
MTQDFNQIIKKPYTNPLLTINTANETRLVVILLVMIELRILCFTTFN